MVGGLSEVQKSDEKINLLVKNVKKEFENKTYSTEIFEPDTYKSQIVNGVNYFIKIKTDKEYVHIRVHEALPHEQSKVTYNNHQLEKKKEDEITYF